jgi:hypothetical protein
LSDDFESVDGIQYGRETLSQDRMVIDKKYPDFFSPHGGGRVS